MYNTFLYIVSNDGVDTSDSYPFKGKVRKLTLQFHNEVLKF